VRVSEIRLADLAATERLAARIAAVAQPGDVIALQGPLGAGKTAFARGFIAALMRAEHRAAEDVPSPPFTLVQSYDFARLTVHHFDLYRLEDADEARELGLDEARDGGVVLIEWPERLGAWLAPDRLHITLAPGPAPDVRMACIEAFGNWQGRWEDE